MIEALKSFISAKWVDALILIGIGIIVAMSYPNYVLTTDTFALEKQKIQQKIDVNIAALKIANADLEESILRKEKNDILDLIDAKKAKQRHLDRLQEINTRLQLLDTSKIGWQKIMESQ